MIFNQEEVIALCKELGIDMIEGNVPKMNGKDITEDDSKGFFYKEDEDYVAYNKVFTIEEQISFNIQIEDIIIEKKSIDDSSMEFKINNGFLDKNMQKNVAVDDLIQAA